MNNFYQQEYKANYSEVTEEITSMPTDKELVEMKNSNFANKRNYTPFVTKLLNSTSGRILDYGTSWGYSVYQLKEAGFDAEGFEISRARAEFGKKINVVIHSSREKVRNDHDLIMSSHAIEHLPVISDFVEFCRKKLGKEGIFMAFCPNGSAEYRKREPYVFHVGWGFLHPNYLDIEFATTCFKHNPYLVLTGDWIFDLNLLQSWDGISQVVGSQRDGHELLVIAKPNVII
ncbi:MAG: methyltransferase domain-containing protein [Chryseolinea sp.]